MDAWSTLRAGELTGLDPANDGADGGPPTSGWRYPGQPRSSDDRLAPLHRAAAGGHAELIAPLLAAGAALELRTAGGRTALMLAARMGHWTCVDALLAAGAETAATTHRGETALIGAASEGRPAVVSRLLSAGAPLDQTSGGIGAVQHAAQHARAAKVACREHRGRASNGDALRFVDGRIERDGVLLDWPRSVALLDEPGLGHAVRHYLGALASVVLLAEAGADLSFRTRNGASLFHSLAEVGEPALLDYVTDWRLAADNGTTPSHAVAISRRPDGLDRALAAGASVDVRDGAGLTPLHHLADQGAPAEMIHMLLDAGADPRAPVTSSRVYPEGWTAVDIARKWNDGATLAVLKGRGRIANDS